MLSFKILWQNEKKDKWSKCGKILIIVNLDDGNMGRVHCTILHTFVFEVFILRKKGTPCIADTIGNQCHQ